MQQSLEVMMKGALDSFLVEGSMESISHEINHQMAQGKQLVLLKTPDDRAIAINVNNINTIKAPRAEDVFFQ